jgi:hypothetical protein
MTKPDDQPSFDGEPLPLTKGMIEAVQMIRAWEDSDELAVTLARRLFTLYERLRGEEP